MTEHSTRTLVTGATGDIGQTLTRLLASGGHQFTVMCRRPEQLESFRSEGIGAVHGDFADAASIRAAAKGCDQLFLLPPFTPQMYPQATQAIDAARAAGVGHVVKISASDAGPRARVPWAADHWRIDGHLRDSGVAWTTLRASAFMTAVTQLAPVIRHGVLPGTSGRGTTTWIDSADIAAAAQRVLTDPAARGGSHDQGRSYLLTGTRPLSFPQIADILTDELGRRVRYLPVPAPLVYLGARVKGISRPWARGFVDQFAVVVRRGLDGVRDYSSDLEDLLGRPATDMRTFIRAHRQQFV